MTFDERVDAAGRAVHKGWQHPDFVADIRRALEAAYPELHGDKPTHELVTRKTHEERVLVALLALAAANIPTDIQDLLVAGNPNMGVAPGALSKALHRPSDKGENT